jgi:hypothetical protein
VFTLVDDRSQPRDARTATNRRQLEQGQLRKGFSKVNSKIFRSFLTVLVLGALVTTALAQRTAARQPATLMASLPPSDAVAIVNVSRVFNEAMPKLLADNPAKIAEVTSELEKFKTQTGLDARSFEQIALGFTYKYPRAGVTKISTVALARGTFNASALTAAGRLAANGKYVEQKYQGKTIYIFSFDRIIRLFGVWNMNVSDLAVTPVDANTLALGDLDAIHGVIDATRTRKHANPDLLALASRDPNAIVGFGGNISPLLLENLSLSNDTIARELTAVRQVYGTLGMTPTDLELMMTARTVDNYSAKNLGDTVEGLKQLGAFFVSRLAAAKGALARTALSNLKVTTVGNELQLRTAVAQSQVAPLIRGN